MKDKTLIVPLLLASIPAAFFLEHLLAVALGPRIPAPPLTLMAAAVWLPVLPFSPRLFLAGATGFIIDTFGEATFGTFIFVLFSAALITEALRAFVPVQEWSVGHLSISFVLAVSAVLLSPLTKTAIVFMRAQF